ncbi:voltage-gated potassium channel [Ceratobasidium sp. AG-I]|nr:voltage-gated potassium channel [Ceratobasidium sp. AG-I]
MNADTPLSQSFASIAPLTAAIIAPLAVLLDIPALTEKWYIRNGEPQSDPLASLILSGLSLGFSIFANALLVVRFSLRDENNGWIATQVSILCWIIKVVTAIVNLVVFGALTRNQPSFSYAEGFWSAVISLLAAGIILALLLFRWAIKPKDASYQHQIDAAGRHFMLLNTSLIALIAFSALIFSKIEDWTYLQGVYFMTVTLITVGFGDFCPTKPSTKVLLFPLALLGITLLANCISTIVTFFDRHPQKRNVQDQDQDRTQIFAQLEKEQHSPLKSPFEREVEYLHRLHKRRELYELGRSVTGFLAFWFAGAAIFAAVESWSYGDALYFCYVFFLTFGYGDFAPISPAGRVIFIVYSIIAVPVMASFAVQAVQRVTERISIERMEERWAQAGHKTSPESKQSSSDNESRAPTNPVSQAETETGGKGKATDLESHKTHSELVANHLSKLHQRSNPGSDHISNQSFEQKTVVQTEDLKNLLEHAVSLERTARHLLLAHLKEGSDAQLHLLADCNLQAKDLSELEGNTRKDVIVGGTIAKSNEGEKLDGNGQVNENRAEKANRMNNTEAGIKPAPDDREEWEKFGIAEVPVGGMGDKETLKAVKEFRKHVAEVLALGSYMRGLERRELSELCRSVTGFLAFWFAGAAIFAAVESWSYGDALYFRYVFFLSFGYGDFAPISPAGRVIFIVYSIIAVPVMASFAVQAVQKVTERMSIKRMEERWAQAGNKTSPESKQSSSDNEGQALADSVSQAEVEGKTHSELVAGHLSNPDFQTEDLKNLLEYAVSLERTARHLLLAHLEEGSDAQLHLLADCNLQAKDLRELKGNMGKGMNVGGTIAGSNEGEKLDGNGQANRNAVGKTNRTNDTEAGVRPAPGGQEEWEKIGIADVPVGGMGDKETLKAVKEFRKHVAEVLALGSYMRGLEGAEKYAFERRRKE